MFDVGEFVSYGAIGICQVEGITQMEVDRFHMKKEYYILRPLYEKKRTIYCPVDTTKVTIRRNLTEQESYELIRKVPELEMLPLENKKIYESSCRSAVMSGNCEEWMKLLKTLRYERKMRVKQGRKNTSSNEKYLHDVEGKLYGELSVSLNMERTQVEDMLGEIFDKIMV